MPFRSGVCISSSPLGVPKVSLAVLQSHMFWGLTFLVQELQAGEPDVELGPLAPWGETLQL